MRIRALSISLALLALAASGAAAENLTDRIQASRMTVLQVDRDTGMFQCAEHKRWTKVSQADLERVSPGDIVRVERQEGTVARITVVRRAAEESISVER